MKINGKPVVDAAKPLRVTITAQDAIKGKSKNPSSCAAARAIVRGYRDNGAKGARVHLGRTYIEYPDKWVRYKTPASLKLEIVSFDRGAKPAYTEGDYTLMRVQPCERFGARPAATKIAGPEKTRHKNRHIARVHHHIEGVRARGANR